ncbi:uncharacterized protein LOC135376898 [Ornithodoros turicata]|uniref:uncharacterized protein LOC135376898 n=1 Tax=Ornithodoros turicata TaxID=34597 RepID=UPI0031393C97
MATPEDDPPRRINYIKCRASGCKNSRLNCNLSFFGFPGDERKSAWIEYAGQPEYATLPPDQLKHQKLCEAHFTSDAFTNRQKTRLKRTAVPTVPLQSVQRCPATIAGRIEHAEVSAPHSPTPSTSYHQSHEPGQASGHTETTVWSAPDSPIPSTSYHQSHEPGEASGHTETTVWSAPDSPIPSTSYHQSHEPGEASGQTETTVETVPHFLAPMTSPPQLNVPREASGISSVLAATKGSVVPSPTPGTSSGTSSPCSAPQDLSPLAEPLESDTVDARPRDSGRRQTHASGSGTIHRRGRPRKQRTPRTASLIHQLQVSRERLRRALFRSRATLHFGGLTRSQIVFAASRYLSKRALSLFRVQLFLQPLNKFGRRWPPQFRSFALNLHFKGPQAYRYLSKVLALPSESSLRSWLKDIAVEPGVMPSVLQGLKTRLQGLPPKDRTCTMIFDEMSIKEHLQYDSGSDVVYGFVDTGKERNSEMAKSALLVVLSGITKAWVQPLSYIFSRSTVSADILNDLLQDLIRQLHSLGVFVKAVVCDQGASNCALCRKLGISPSKPYLCVDESKVYFIFDPPHLMKTTRNMLLKHDLQIGDAQHKVQWAFIKEFYESDFPLKVRLAPKLTDDHIHPTVFSRMKVKFATQVMSNSLSTGIAVLISTGYMHPAATATSDFLLRMDVLFDCLNSSSIQQGDDKKMRFAISDSTKHKELLESAVQWIAQWKFDSDRQPPTVRGWQITICAILALWEDLHQNFGFEHLLTRRLNQDPVENMFGQFRQMHGCNETPNAFQFVAGLKHTLAGNLMKLPSKGNCEADTTELLNDLLHMPVSSTASSSYEPADSQGLPAVEEMQAEHDMRDVQEPDNIIEANAQYAYAGSLVHSFLKKSECPNCPNLLKAADEGLLRPEGLYSYLQSESQMSGSTFCIPSDAFFACFCKLESIFLREVAKVLHRKGVKQRLISAFTQSSHEPFCCAACQAHFISFFAIKRMQYHIRLKNREGAEAAHRRSEQRKRKKLPT